MSNPSWDSIPLLALKCILEHLDQRSAFRAMSTCHHWRSALLMYEGHKDVLKLHTEKQVKCAFLTRVFKRHTRRLEVYVPHDGNEALIIGTMNYVLPRFYDAPNLVEVAVVGPAYMTISRSVYLQLISLISDSLVFKHAHKLQKLALFGCDLNYEEVMDPINRKTEEMKKGEFFSSRPYIAYNELSPGDDNSILSRNNLKLMTCSALTTLIFDYSLITTESIATLSKLDNFKLLSLNITARQGLRLQPIEWDEVTPLFSKGLEVAVNMIALTEPNDFTYVMENAFVPEMPLVALTVLYCKKVDMELICNVSKLYNATLRDLRWADKPECDKKMRFNSLTWKQGHGRPFNNMNPFIFLAWQCPYLQKLSIHGYWMCEYDILGIMRLRSNIQLSVSSIYDSTDPTSLCGLQVPRVIGTCMLRVLHTDARDLHAKTRDISRHAEVESIYYPSPPGSARVHPGLCKIATNVAKAELIVQEVMGVT